MRSNSNVVRAKLLILFLTLALSFLTSCSKPPFQPAELKAGVFVYTRGKARTPGFHSACKVSHWSETEDSETNRKFVKGYKTLFGEAPDNTTALTCDAFQILFQAAAAGPVQPNRPI